MVVDGREKKLQTLLNTGVESSNQEGPERDVLVVLNGPQSRHRVTWQDKAET